LPKSREKKQRARGKEQGAESKGKEPGKRMAVCRQQVRDVDPTVTSYIASETAAATTSEEDWIWKKSHEYSLGLELDLELEICLILASQPEKTPAFAH
jgi:hypothetical protein